MKKFLFISFTIIAFGTSRGQSKWQTGIEGGLDPGLFLDLLEKNPTPLIAVPAALTVQYPFSKIFSIKSGIAYRDNIISVNMPHNTPFPQPPTPTGFVLYDLSVPVLARWEWGDHSKFFINIGPYFSYTFKSKIEIQVEDNNGNYHYNTANIQGYNPFDIGLSAGLGYIIPLNSKFELTSELRFNLGLHQIDYPFSSWGTFTNQTADLVLGLRYKL